MNNYKYNDKNIYKDNYININKTFNDYNINIEKINKNYEKLNINYELNKKIEKEYYKSQTPQEQLDIIRAYAIDLSQRKKREKQEKSNISQSDLLLIKKIFDFSNCRRDLLDNSLEIIEFFKMCEIDLSAFLSYGVNTNTYKDTWGDLILKILKFNDTTNFISTVWKYYRDAYFNPKNKNQRIVSFINFLDTYEEYAILLKNIMKNNPTAIPTDIKSALDDLFNPTNRILLHDSKNSNVLRQISTVDELKKYQEKADDKIINLILAFKSLEEKKRAITVLFFNTTTFEDLIQTYGNTERLKLLQFNNRKNPHIVELIENILVMTSFIEGVLNIKTDSEFDLFLTKLKDNKEYLSTIRRMLSKYEKMMKTLYELESNYNLTNIKRVCEEGKVNGESLKEEIQLGDKKIRILYLANCKYALYAHVVSPKETVDELMQGKDKENQVFISLSPISHRNQVYYRKPFDKIILAYDHIPEGNFVLGSNQNVGSNKLIRKNSADFTNPIQYKQLGILETSMAPYGNNAETLVLREGLKPCGIIIPRFKKPTYEEYVYSLKYDLPFIITQNQEMGIRNPQDIEYTKNVGDTHIDSHELYQDFIGIQDDLFDKTNSNKIGVLTDIHGMYEPTLAILEDMRKKGITEIYSLGDNIGFGPNPHEVLELLRKYNVKSIYGNHEIYSVDGMDALGEHMSTLSQHTVSQDKKRTEWTRKQLTDQDIEDIMKYDSKIVITKGGKKITLVHSRRKDLYEKEGHFTKPEIDDDSIVIEGHEHFESEQNNNLKLRAAGMGFSGSDYGKAHYLIIEEDGSFTRVNVPYNIKNFKESINESSMDDEVRSTIDRFTRR